MRTPEEAAATIHIPDPALDEQSIRARLAEALAARRYLPDVAQIGPKALRPENTAVAPSTTETLNRLMIDLLAQEPLHEKPFTSAVPLLGPVIVAFRTAWNWLSTRWYVLPIMQQQARLNQQMLLVLTELAQRHELDTQRIAHLEAQLHREEK
ncbi:MAG: hypothetical protein R3D55_27790 [Chloroflexota bacterium]